MFNSGATYARIIVGHLSGTGAINQTSGTVGNQRGSFYLGRDGGTGYYNLSGGVLNPGQTAYIGRNGGYGELNITGSGQFIFNQNDNGLRVGTVTNASPTVGIIRQNGDDTFAHIQTSASVFFGQDANTQGTYELNAGTLVVEIQKDVLTGAHFGQNLGATGNFLQTGGTSTFLNTLTTFGHGGYGEFSLEGGVSQHAVGILLGNLATGTGVVCLKGGVLEIGGTNGIRQGDGFGQIYFAGGTLSATSNFTTSVAINLTSDSTTTVNTNAFNVTLNSVMNGPGHLVKVGSGTLFLTAANTYTGETEVSDGTLNVTSSGRTGSGNVTIGATATLMGEGTVAGHANVFGQLKPGNSPGTLTFENGLTLQSTSETTMEVLGVAMGQYDIIRITGGDFTLGGAMVIDMGLMADGEYTIFLFDLDNSVEVLGDFEQVLLAGAYGNHLFTYNEMDATWELTAGLNSFVFHSMTGELNINLIPEPSTGTVLLGAGALLWLRRRRKRQS